MAIRTIAKPRRWDGRRRMTEAEYLALPEVKPYLEFIDGEVVQKSMPTSRHRKAVYEIDGRFWRYSQEYGGEGGPEGRVRLSSGFYVLPDTAYWAAGRPAGDDSIPSVAIEVLSPDDSRSDARKKCRWYIESGVVTAWLIDPVRRTAELFGDGHDGTLLRPPEGVLTSSAMPGFALALADLFAALDEPA